jgi:hypothetical protein
MYMISNTIASWPEKYTFQRPDWPVHPLLQPNHAVNLILQQHHTHGGIWVLPACEISVQHDELWMSIIGKSFCVESGFWPTFVHQLAEENTIGRCHEHFPCVLNQFETCRLIHNCDWHGETCKSSLRREKATILWANLLGCHQSKTFHHSNLTFKYPLTFLSVKLRNNLGLSMQKVLVKCSPQGNGIRPLG